MLRYYFFISKIYLWKTLNFNIVQIYIKIQIIIIIVFKTNLEVDEIQVMSWKDQHQNKNGCYHNFKFQLRVDLEQRGS
jgi:hypothetical protein